MKTNNIISSEKKFIMQTYTRPKIVIERGKGCYLYDKNGKKYIDLLGGLATCPLGHGNVQLAEAVKSQVSKITNTTNLYYTEEQVILAEKLAKISGIEKTFFSNSGTESVETAIKLARKHTKKTEIISTKNSFHGRTFGSLAATGKDKIKLPFAPMLQGFVHVDYGNPDSIEQAITANTAAVIVEPIQGEAGIIMPPEDYIKNLHEICQKDNILLILDEVQTGCGRTGKFFAFQHTNIKPDIVTIAKGLANGIPIGATIAREEIASSFEKSDHGSTFGGNPVASKAANFTINYIIKKNLIKNASIQGNYLIKKLKTINSKLIKEIRGKGLMIGIEMKNNNENRQKQLIEKGLLVNSTNENVLRFLPPLIITKNIIDNSIKILKEVIENEN